MVHAKEERARVGVVGEGTRVFFRVFAKKVALFVRCRQDVACT